MLPSTTRQKLLRAGFWLLLAYIAITSTVVIAIQFQLIPVPEKTVAQEKKTHQLTDELLLSETSFSKLFAREYLSWSKEDEESRKIRLKSFWRKGIDPQGGLDFDQTTWNSFPQNIEVWKVEERPNSQGIKEVTVYAETYLTKVDNPDLQKRIDRYMVIPIKKSGASYRVVDIPHFIAPPEANELPAQEKKQEDKGETVDLSIKENVENDFLPEFWKLYTDDSSKGIRYLMKNNQNLSTLGGIMKYIDSTKVEVYKQQDHYLVENDVVLQDLASDTKMSFHYQLKLVKEKNRWFILDVKHGEGL